MADVDEDGRPDPGLSRSTPPYQALLPGFDRLSRSTFARGSLSRRRVVQAVVGLVVLAAAIATVVAVTYFLG